MYVEIPFKPAFREPMRNGIKHYTSRSKKYGKPGDLFVAFGITFQIDEVTKAKLGDVIKNLWKEEGFRSKEEFLEFWAKLHPRKKFDLGTEVFLHQFHEVIRKTSTSKK